MRIFGRLGALLNLSLLSHLGLRHGCLIVAKQNSNDYRSKEIQLMLSLKFHHEKTLGELPLDVAINAMTKVWASCQHEAGDCDDGSPLDAEKTLVYDRQKLSRTIGLQ